MTGLAQTSSVYTDAVASASTPISTGAFSIKVGSATAVPVTIDSSNNTLAGVAATINAANIGVSAGVITDAAGARLSILSSSSGAAGDLTISGAVTGLNFHKAVTGADASLTVDGIPIDSATNTVAGVIPGVTLNLTGTSSGAVTFGVAADTTQAASAAPDGRFIAGDGPAADVLRNFVFDDRKRRHELALGPRHFSQ